MRERTETERGLAPVTGFALRQRRVNVSIPDRSAVPFVSQALREEGKGPEPMMQGRLGAASQAPFAPQATPTWLTGT